MSPIIRRLHLIREASRAGHLNGYEGLVLRELSDHLSDQNDTIGWFIKQDDLAAECGIGVRTANRTLGKLMRRGLVEAEERGKRKSLRYFINETKLASLGQGDTANEAQSERRSPAETTPRRRSGHSQGGVAGTANEAYGLRLGGVADSSQLPPKTPPDENSPQRGAAAGSSPKEKNKSKEVTPADEDLDRSADEEEQKQKQRAKLLTAIATSLEDLERRYGIKKSHEDYKTLATTFRQKICPACHEVSKERGWPTPPTKELLRDLADIIADESGEYSGGCSWGLVFETPARLADAYFGYLANLENSLDGEAAQIARGELTRAELVPKYMPAELARIDRKTAEIIAYNAEQMRRMEEAIAASEATLPPYKPIKPTKPCYCDSVPPQVRERLIKEIASP